MQIQSINIKNFKGIKNYKGEINGKNVYLVGGNGTGKTSFIDAVWCGLTGKNLPPEPTTDGAKKGLIELDLGDYIARTKFTKGRPAVFEIENKKTNKDTEKFVKAPRSFMEEKIGVLHFDIMDFFSKSNKAQLEYFSKIMGADFSDLDENIEENAESRKLDKRELKSLSDTLPYFDPRDAEKDLVNVVDLSKKIAAEREKTQTFERIENGVEDRIKQSADLNIKITALKEQLENISSEITGANNWIQDPANIPLNSEAFQELEKSLDNVTEVNNKINSAKAAKLQEQTIEDLEKNIEKSNDKITDLRTKKAERISNAINVEGLSYSVEGECFLYNGLPFDKNQINTAAQLIAGMKIGASTLKELKILKVDASLIDKSNFEEVLEWAEAQNIELFVELVNRDSAKLEITVDIDGAY